LKDGLAANTPVYAALAASAISFIAISLLGRAEAARAYRDAPAPQRHREAPAPQRHRDAPARPAGAE
jgi:SSS family solute:Na+ symporter